MPLTTRPTPTRPATCRAALFHGAGKPLELRDFPVPEPSAREALVRVDCCTLCGSDLHTVTGARSEPVPSILGHEVLGVIAEVGDPPPSDIDGHRLEPGDRVTWSTSISCGSCDRCGNGFPQKCRQLAKYGHERAEGRTALSGGLAEWILLRPGTAVVKLNGESPDEVLCPVNCATATVAAACRVAGPLAGRRVMILGAGMLGLTAAALARTLDAAHVAVCDPQTERLARATRFGADRLVPWLGGPGELSERLSQDAATGAFDVVLELSGSPDAVEAACLLGDLGAQIVLVGSVMPSPPAPIDPERIVRRWLTIRGVHNYVPDDLRTAVAFLERGGAGFPFAELVEHTFALEDVNEALATAVRDRPVRVAVRPRPPK